MAPKVSFIVAIYNVGQYIEQCVRSLYEQTLEDIEIILVDDCTPDDSIAIALRTLEDYPGRKSQVRLIRHEENKGLSLVRKEGLMEARGEYMMYVDGDDFVDVRLGELMYAKAVEKDADMVICDFYRLKEDSCRPDTVLSDGIVGDGENVRSDIINRRVPLFLWVRMIRRSVFIDNEIAWPVRNMGEDTVISTVAAFYSKRFAQVDIPLYYYRYNPASISKDLTEIRCVNNLHDFKCNVEVYLRFLNDKGVADKYGYGIFVNKMRTKNRVLRHVGRREIRKLWLRTYPEANWTFLFGNKYYKSSYREWVWLFAIAFGLYPRLKKHLWSKRFALKEELF